ncbi:uncharacterized protein A4U43_C08F36380 [Asparagus officinalis]|uniref:uncharacterized protein LOC109822817 n=1 Tax=Asparagus officinalis TaxID=4686 RepID=UPI00098E1C75|nr:uncharacterized protein LOC109822817 [Asparagus officinalis]ONK62060.1 uncharacterized protein A4U43_C08F36380 [Asparagus officinalis]
MEDWKKLRRGDPRRSLFMLLFLCVLVVCLLLLLNMRLPEVSPGGFGEGTYRKLIRRTSSRELELGELGKLIVAMLPDDLPFTIFTPSEEAFEHVLNLRPNDSLVRDKVNNTFAILSRVMGFSAIPRHLPSEAVAVLKEMSFDSVSGYRLYAWKSHSGTLFVNNVKSERVNMRKGEIIVHLMNGVIMDPEFKQSFLTDDDD